MLIGGWSIVSINETSVDMYVFYYDSVIATTFLMFFPFWIFLVFFSPFSFIYSVLLSILSL